jgi:hypothetical protein
MSKLNTKQRDRMNTIALNLNNMGLRLGQSYMLALHDIDKILYNEIKNTEYDCFYDDNKIKSFFEFINK